MDMAPKPASEFGDNWSEPLEHADKQKLTAYFQAKETLQANLGYLRFRVGGGETVIDLNPKLRQFGVTFEVPRGSLMTAVEYQVFDDLLIGNFMRTTLHGGVKFKSQFNQRVAKYSDNGGANTDAQLRNYFFEYFGRAPLDMLFHFLEVKSEDIFRKLVPMNSLPYRRIQNLYWRLK